MATPDHSEVTATTGAYYITFRPTCAGNYLNIPVSFSSSSQNMFFYGYHLEVLGLTDGLSSSDIQNVINNSGLATASSVAEVNSSVSEVKQEITGMQNEQKETNKKLDEQNETSKGILGKIKDILSYINPFSENFFAYKLIELLIDGLKKLFVPDNFDFINDFKDSLENKLGFIASVPIQLIDYILSLKDKVFTPMNTFTFPSVSIFGYYFWNSTTINLNEGLSWISAFKYLTDLACVIIMVNTLRKWYANFTGGAEK